MSRFARTRGEIAPVQVPKICPLLQLHMRARRARDARRVALLRFTVIESVYEPRELALSRLGGYSRDTALLNTEY